MRFPVSKKRIGWGFLALNTPQFAQTFISLMVAPFLTPTDLGLVALAAGVMLFFENLRDAGLQEALLREENLTAELLNATTWFLFFGGCFWVLILLLCAPWVAVLLKAPALKEILYVLAILLPLEGLNRLPIALLMREFAYRKLFFYQIIPLLVSVTIALLLARKGWRYWALIYASIVAAIIRTLLLFSVHRPGFKSDWKSFKRLILFGFHIVWQFFLGWLNVNALRFMISHFLGVFTLGLLSFALSIGWRPFTFLSFPLLKMALPCFAKFRNDWKALKQAYWKFFKRAVPAAWLLASVIILLIPPFLPKIFGPQWEGASSLVRFFALIGAIQSLGWLTPELFKALGYPQVISKLLFAQVFIGLLIYFFVIPHGLKAFLSTFFFLELGFAFFNFFLAQFFLER